MRKWNIFGLFVLLLTVLIACNRAQSTEQAIKNVPVTAKAETDALIVSTTAELISSITPDAHIILKSGTYNFSALTEAEIAGAGAYVNPNLLKQGEFFIMPDDRENGLPDAAAMRVKQEQLIGRAAIRVAPFITVCVFKAK